MPAPSKKLTYFPYAKGLYKKGYSLSRISSEIPDVHYNTLAKWFKEEGIVVERRPWVGNTEAPVLLEQVCGRCKQIFLTADEDLFCSRICTSIASGQGTNKKGKGRTKKDLARSWRRKVNPPQSFTKVPKSEAEALDQAKWSNGRSRTLKFGGDIEYFSYASIFERDNWICQLCFLPINMELSHPDPASPSIDHVIPITKGGSHTRLNVQATHLGCNLSKGTRI